jgi:hypothetical protein
MDDGIPWRRTTSSKNTHATELAIYRCASGMKCVYLEKRSTIVRITDFPCTRGRASMKSIAISSQMRAGTVMAEGDLLDVVAQICFVDM